MNVFDQIIDEGEEFLTFKNLNNKEDDIYENDKLENYEVLSVLGRGGFGFVYKVKHKKNNRIYVMKRIQKEYENEKDKIKEKYNYTEIKILIKKLYHPHIIKYYQHFENEKYIYLIIEYMENGSLDDFIHIHKKRNSKIPNGIIWNLFLQCSSALTYIHSQNIIHRDLKPENLLLDNNMYLKIGDFGVSRKVQNKCSDKYTIVGSYDYRAPEINEENYDEKIDIYSLGIIFHNLISCAENKDDKDLSDLTKLMMKHIPNDRPTAKEVFDNVQKIYKDKYLKNTCMDALIRCLYSLNRMTSHFLKSENFSEYKIMNIIKDQYIKCLEAFTDKKINKWFKEVDNMREILASSNQILEMNKEIEPIFLLSMLFKGLHNELNKPISNDKNFNNRDIITNKLVIQTDKNESKLNFINNFLIKQNSYISNNFMGLIKEIRLCKNCDLKTYKFKSYFCVTFDLNKLIFKNLSLDKKVTIEDCFASQKTEEILKDLMCCNCIKMTQHSTYKFYYSGPEFLIINIKNDCLNKVVLYLNKILDLKNHLEFQNLPTKFELKGILKQKHEIYFSNINIEKNWYKCEQKKIEEIKFPECKDTNEKIIMLFYQSIEKN